MALEVIIWPWRYICTFTLKTKPVFNSTRKRLILRHNGSFFNFVLQLPKTAYGPTILPPKRILRFDDRNYGTFDESSQT